MIIDIKPNDLQEMLQKLNVMHHLSEQKQTFIPKYGAAARSREKYMGAPKVDVTGYS